MDLFIALYVVLYLHHKGLLVNEKKSPEVGDYFQSRLHNVPNTHETGEPLVICFSLTVQ